MIRLVQRAYKFALAPTPTIERAFNSHAGGARFAYNWGVQQIADALDARIAEEAAGVPDAQKTQLPDHFGLCKAWTAHKDAHAEVPDDRGRTLEWVGENFVGTYQAALRDAHGAWKKFFDSRTGRRKGRAMGRPRFKSRHKTAPSFQMHGSVRMADKSHIVLPKVGPVKVPGKLRLPGWEDRNGRIARSLARALRRGEIGCPTCSGTGETVALRRDGKLLAPAVVKCPDCKGSLTVPAGRIVRATISRGASGTWWCSVTAQIAMEVRGEPCRDCTGGKVAEERVSPKGVVSWVSVDCARCNGAGVVAQPSKRQQANGAIGLDLGTRYLAVDSDGTMYPNPQHLENALKELRVAQKTLSRRQRTKDDAGKVHESNRRRKARARVGEIHERVALMRKDSADRLTSRMARTFAKVAVEGWDAQQVAAKEDKDLPRRERKRRNRQLADAAPGMVRWQLEYKTSWRGSSFWKGDKHQETGRTCSACGSVRTKPVPLTDEHFRCDACGLRLDRRVNSARVVKRMADGRGKPGAVGHPPLPPKPRGGDVRPEGPRPGGRSSVKRAARSRSPDRPQTGTAAAERSQPSPTRS